MPLGTIFSKFGKSPGTGAISDGRRRVKRTAPHHKMLAWHRIVQCVEHVNKTLVRIHLDCKG